MAAPNGPVSEASARRLTALLDAARAGTPRRILERVGGGNSHETWKVCAGQTLLAVRVAQAVPRFAASLELEAVARAVAAEAGIASQLLYFDRSDGSCVSSWAPGRAWTEEALSRPARVWRLARLLARLHSIRIDAPAFDLVAAVRGYRDLLQRELCHDVQLRGRIAELESAVARFVAQRRVGGLCHNDLVVQNIVGYSRVQLLDWEYAAANDRLFDVATLTGLHRLSAQARSHLIAAFELSAAERQRLSATEDLVRLLAWIWARAERVRRADDPRPERWLRLEGLTDRG